MRNGTEDLLPVCWVTLPAQCGFQGSSPRRRVVLPYLHPERYVTRSAVNLLKVEQEPAFKSRWRLVVHDVDGEVYQSALGSQQDVQRAYALLDPVIEPEALSRP
jgi:hypothetical protein